MSDSLDVRTSAGTKLAGSVDRFVLGGEDIACPLRVGPPNCVVAVGASFDVNSLIFQSSLLLTAKKKPGA